MAADTKSTWGLAAPVPRFGENESLLVAGGLGGPFTIWLYTPLRNAITLGSQAPSAATHPASALYKEVFARGLAGGWTGCTTTVAVSSVQFMCMGPLYHVYASKLGATLAVGATGLTESLISYGSQTRNAQLAYNATVPAASRVAVQHPLNPVGVGFPPHVMRNVAAMTGCRLVTGPCTTAITSLTHATGLRPDPSVLQVAGDFAGCLLGAAMSMPLNQSYNYLVTATPEARSAGVVSSTVGFLKSQYLNKAADGRVTISRTVARDVFMRCAYIAPQLTTYMFIERGLMAYGRRLDQERGGAADDVRLL
jgi:hypothetical protein